ncbi:MAG: hypothetical protein KBC11_01225 [Candidatus Pacebacteria bacterium]|nr:hypothetical protein [Candidatus Paceibacterota bacterium]
MTNLQPKPSTLELINSDIALFPIIEKPDIKKNFHLDHSKEKILGIADLPPVFAHRVKMFNLYGKTFVCKNHPLTFSVFDEKDLSLPSVEEYWNQVIHITRKGSCPRIWIIAPQYLCEHIMNDYVKDTNGFYYHDPKNQKEHTYYMVTNSNKIETHILFSES